MRYEARGGHGPHPMSTLKQGYHVVTAFAKGWSISASPSVSDHRTTPRARPGIQDQDRREGLTPDVIHQAFRKYLINGKSMKCLQKCSPDQVSSRSSYVFTFHTMRNFVVYTTFRRRILGPCAELIQRGYTS